MTLGAGLVLDLLQIAPPGGRLQLVLMRHLPPAICQNLGWWKVAVLGEGSSRGFGGGG